MVPIVYIITYVKKQKQLEVPNKEERKHLKDGS